MPLPPRPRDLKKSGLSFEFKKTPKVRDRRSLDAALRRFQESRAAPKSEEFTVRLRATEIKSADVARLIDVAKQRQAPLRYMVETARFSLATHAGVFYSALIAQQYLEWKTYYETLLLEDLTQEEKNNCTYNWDTLRNAYLNGLRSAGLRDANDATLVRMARALTANSANYTAFLRILGNGVDEELPSPPSGPPEAEIQSGGVSSTSPTGGSDTVAPANWCDDGIQGVDTWRWAADFELKHTFKIACGLKCRINWLKSRCKVKYCRRTVTLLQGSVSFALEIGYDIGCCGGSAWGSGVTKACAIVAGREVCASCTASVTAVVGQGQVNSSSGSCAYGVGVTITFSCSVEGQRVFVAQLGSTSVVVGPCPPANFPC